MNWSQIFYLLTIVLFVVSLVVSAIVRARFNKYSKRPNARGYTGTQAAAAILRANGLGGLTIAQGGSTLSDNYNSVNRVLTLSTGVYDRATVSAVAVAAHECGHALQHAEKYPLLIFRKALVPVCNIGSMGAYVSILLGMFFSNENLILVGALLFSGIVLFNLVTLPVEIDASKRALAEIERLGLLTEEEQKGGKRVLRAAAMTYFLALVSSVVQLLRLLSMANRKR